MDLILDTNDCKKSKDSHWIQTITLISKSYKMTYAITLGPDSDDIHTSQDRLFKDLNLLYNGNIINNRLVYLSLIAYIADQPERRTLSGLATGSSSYHQRWGVIYNHNNLNDIIDGLSEINFSNITFTTLKQRYRTIFQRHVVQRETNKSQTRDMMRKAGFSEKVQEKLLTLHHNDDPSTKWPVCWNVCKRDSDYIEVNSLFPDAPMHLIFLGATIFIYIYEINESHGKKIL